MAKQNISMSAWTIMMTHDALSRHARWQKLLVQDNLSYYRLCLDYCSEQFWGCRWLSKLPDSAKLALVDRCLAYGAPQHFIFRKAAIARQVQHCISDGFTQLVVMGGGFDLLAVATARQHPQVQCFEIDTPAMNGHKMTLLKTRFGDVPANFHARGVDFSQSSLAQAMAAFAAFDPAKPTVFVAEGLTMYLKEAEVVAILGDVRASCKGQAGLVFTAIAKPPESGHSLWTRVREAVLSHDEENFHWCMEPGDMPAFLAQHGFTQHYLTGYSDFQKDWRTDDEMKLLAKQRGEYLVYATA